MSALPVLLLVVVTGGTGMSERLTFWLDAQLSDEQQAETIALAMERMANDTGRLARASRREDADVLVRLRIGSLRSERADGGQLQSLGPDETTPASTSPANSTSIELDFHIVDVARGETVFDQKLRCGVPLTSGNRIADPALRARLSHVVDVVDDWLQKYPPVVGSAVANIERTSGTDQARTIYDEAVRTARAGYQEAALNLFAEAQPAFKQNGLRRDEGLAWEWLAALMARTGRPLDVAVRYASQAVKIARELSDPRAEARALVLLAALEARDRDYPRALELLQIARRQARESRATLIEAVAVADTAGLVAIRGYFDDARATQSEALALVSDAGNARAEGRLRLAMAVVSAREDARDRAATLGQLEEVFRLARATGDRSLEADAAFVRAGVRLGTTQLGYLLDGEIDAMRALKLARRLGDARGEAAALALLGAFSHRLVRPPQAAEYLGLAQEKARAVGDVEIVVDSLQLLGEMAPSHERGLDLLDGVLALRRETSDTRREIKTLSDMSRIHTGLGQNDDAWACYQQALGVLDRYVTERGENPYAEDIQESFLTVLKSLMATRTELPFLQGFLELRHLLVIPDPSWDEGG